MAPRRHSIDSQRNFQILANGAMNSLRFEAYKIWAVSVGTAVQHYRLLVPYAYPRKISI